MERWPVAIVVPGPLPLDSMIGGWLSAAVRTRGFLIALLIAGVMMASAGGCGVPEKPDPHARLAVCVAATAERPAGQQIRIEFRRAGTMVAGGSVPVGAVFHAPIPAGADVEVYVDGALLGTSSSSSVAGDAIYLRGDGCPDVPDVDDHIE